MTRDFISVVLTTALCVGCGGPSANVQGTVTIDGQLARNGTVIFHPTIEGPTAYGSIENDGSYSLRVGQGDLNDPDAGEVETGEYIVTVVVNMPSRSDELVGDSGPPMPGARLSAEKYATKDTSPLRQTVKDGPNVVPLEIEGAVAEEADAANTSNDAAPTADETKENAGGQKSAPEVNPNAGSPNGAQGDLAAELNDDAPQAVSSNPTIDAEEQR